MKKVYSEIRKILEGQKAVLERQFKTYMTKKFNRITAQAGNPIVVKNIRSFSEQQDYYQSFARFVKTDPNGMNYLNTFRLEDDAAKYASECIEHCANKIADKVGLLDDVRIKYCDGWRFNITGMKNGHVVQICQDIKLNYSKKGKPFNQYPATITVDGKRTSAKAYKEMISESVMKPVEVLEQFIYMQSFV